MSKNNGNSWIEIGKDAHMLRIDSGSIHVMHLGNNVWSVTKNGRVIGTAQSADDGKLIAVSA